MDARVWIRPSRFPASFADCPPSAAPLRLWPKLRWVLEIPFPPATRGSVRRPAPRTWRWNSHTQRDFGHSRDSRATIATPNTLAATLGGV